MGKKPNSSQVNVWVQMTPLLVYEVNGQCLFPLLAVTSGNITSRYIAYVAQSWDGFPKDGESFASTHPDFDKTFVELSFDGNREYSKDEIDVILRDAEAKLSNGAV